jgi:hypothetical protein
MRENLELNSDFTAEQYRQGEESSFIASQLPVNAVTNVNGLSGPNISFSGGTTGFSFVPAGTTITLVGSATSPALAVATKTANYTLTDSDDVLLIDATAGAVVITLHAVASAKRKRYDFKKIDASANAMTLDGNGAETIDGAATLASVVQWTNFTLFPTSSGWVIL